MTRNEEASIQFMGRGGRMKFDQVRREFKRTLWGEELDNESYGNYNQHSLELEFLHQYEGKKYQCMNCLSVYEENDIRMTNQGNYCSKCFKVYIGCDRAGI
jgi:late competence protein required for DNA uptake (superfamily II DNA/RNA helicase)